MAKIAKKIDEPVAVNDLGLVALRTNKYVLDLWGLGSYEVLEARWEARNVEWLSSLMAHKKVSYAIVYDTWFPYRPTNWIKVGELKLLEKRITPASDTVTFYATSEKKAHKLAEILIEQGKANKSHKFRYIVFKN